LEKFLKINKFSQVFSLKCRKNAQPYLPDSKRFMKNPINVLLIEDDRNTIEAYSFILDQIKVSHPDYEMNLITASCCKSAAAIIENRSTNNNTTIDIAMVDMRLPPTDDGLINSGEDLGIILRKKFPLIKIIIITGYKETLVLSSVLQSVKPCSVLLKGDIDRKILHEAIIKVLNNKKFYSSSVLNMIHKKISSNINIDSHNKLILYELWKGSKTKDLVKKIPLSLGAIEKRKRNMRLQFNASGKDDNELIKIILDKGFQ